jgi:hypothetical protein
MQTTSRIIYAAVLSFGSLAGCNAIADAGSAISGPSYSEFLQLKEGMGCSQAKGVISGNWRLDSSSTIGEGEYRIKTEMWSLTGSFWSISVMCQNNSVVMVSQFGLQ